MRYNKCPRRIGISENNDRTEANKVSQNLAIGQSERTKRYCTGPRSDCGMRRKGQSAITGASLRVEAGRLVRTMPKARTWSYLNRKLTRPKNTDALQRGRHIVMEHPPALNRDTATVSRAKHVCKQTTPHSRKGSTMPVAEAKPWVAPFKTHGSSCYRGR